MPTHFVAQEMPMNRPDSPSGTSERAKPSRRQRIWL